MENKEGTVWRAGFLSSQSV